LNESATLTKSGRLFQIVGAATWKVRDAVTVLYVPACLSLNVKRALVSLTLPSPTLSYNRLYILRSHHLISERLDNKMKIQRWVMHTIIYRLLHNLGKKCWFFKLTLIVWTSMTTSKLSGRFKKTWFLYDKLFLSMWLSLNTTFMIINSYTSPLQTNT